MNANVKPLTHWAIYKGLKLRFRSRTVERVSGVLTDAEGTETVFEYLPIERCLLVGDEEVRINEFGWEIERRYTQ